jgi:hypothetical protein
MNKQTPWWTVLLPSDILRKPISSITVVLLPSVTYLLTLPRMYGMILIVNSDYLPKQC